MVKNIKSKKKGAAKPTTKKRLLFAEHPARWSFREGLCVISAPRE